MIPGEGSVFSWGLMAGMYLEFFYSGLVYGIVGLNKSKKYLYYAESSSVNIDKRVNIELSIDNVSDNLVFGLKINSIPQQLTLLDINISNTKNFIYLFKATEHVGYGNCKLINFGVNRMVDGIETPLVKWDFSGITSEEKLQNKVENKSIYDLVANNIANIDEIIKTLNL